MFSVLDRPYTLCDRISRRELMRIGGLNLLGLSLPALLGVQAQAAAASSDPTFGRAKNVIYLWLQGGPPQHETFDPKPDAPVEIRGPFKPISTNVPGMQFCELLPRTAADRRQAGRRAVDGDRRQHSQSERLLGAHRLPLRRAERRGDQADRLALLRLDRQDAQAERALPALIDRLDAGHHAAQRQRDPGRADGRLLGGSGIPSGSWAIRRTTNYQIEGLELRTAFRRCGSTPRVAARTGRTASRRARTLARPCSNFDEHSPGGLRPAHLRHGARGVSRSRRAGAASASVTARSWGQCVLLARRLVEAGVRLVHVNWPREPGDSAVDNPMWDTHAQNADRLQDVLCPMFDVGLLGADRGSGPARAARRDAGRGHRRVRPHAEDQSVGGRDHWGHVFSFAMAGAGIRGGQVYGSSDKNGGYPARTASQPQTSRPRSSTCWASTIGRRFPIARAGRCR